MRAVFFFLLTMFFSFSVETAFADARLERHELIHEGMKREYWVHDPRAGKYDAPQKPRPLLIVLHGGGGKADRFDVMTGAENSFDALADREDLLIAYPQGYDKQWNDGREIKNVKAQKLDLDDVGFISGMIEELMRSSDVDPRRIYATGPSNGGHMANRLACDLSDKIAAVGIVIANMPVKYENKCHPAHPVSVLIMNGTEDPFIPFDGGTVKVLGQERGEDLSTAQTFSFWLRHAGFKGDGRDIKAEMLPDDDPADRTRVMQQDYKSPGGPEVVLYTVQGGGHTWPGGRQYLFKMLVGRVSHDINATSVIWDFFKENPKR